MNWVTRDSISIGNSVFALQHLRLYCGNVLGSESMRPVPVCIAGIVKARRIPWLNTNMKGDVYVLCWPGHFWAFSLPYRTCPAVIILLLWGRTVITSRIWYLQRSGTNFISTNCHCLHGNMTLWYFKGGTGSGSIWSHQKAVLCLLPCLPSMLPRASCFLKCNFDKSLFEF